MIPRPGTEDLGDAGQRPNSGSAVLVLRRPIGCTFHYTKRRVTDPQVGDQPPPGSARPCRRGLFLSHPHEKGHYNERKICCRSGGCRHPDHVAARCGVGLGRHHTSVRQVQQHRAVRRPPPSVTKVRADSVVRAADMAVRKQSSRCSRRRLTRGSSQPSARAGTSFCHDADNGSQNVASITITDRDRPRQAAPALEPGACLSWYLVACFPFAGGADCFPFPGVGDDDPGFGYSNGPRSYWGV